MDLSIFCKKGSKEDTQLLKLFKKHVDGIVCAVKGNPLDYLEYTNSHHKILQFTLETLNCSGDLAFLDLNKNLSKDRKISCHLYQKLTNTSLILSFHSCAPLQQKDNSDSRDCALFFNTNSE